MFLFILFIASVAFLIYCIYTESPTGIKNREQARAEKYKARMEHLNELAKKYGADSFTESIKFGYNYSIDTRHKLFCDGYDLVPVKNISCCNLRNHYETHNKAISTGLKDGILAGITGCGIIRDASTLNKTYATGKVVMDIKYINANKRYDNISIIFSDVLYAKELKQKIDDMINS